MRLIGVAKITHQLKKSFIGCHIRSTRAVFSFGKTAGIFQQNIVYAPIHIIFNFGLFSPEVKFPGNASFPSKETN